MGLWKLYLVASQQRLDELLYRLLRVDATTSAYSLRRSCSVSATL